MSEPWTTVPVARVAVDVALAHLDRPFDYAVPEPMSESAVPGARVKVRFAGREVSGFVLDRVAASDHQGRLTALRRVVSAEPVLSPQIAELAASVARRYAGSRADVLRLAVPPRHARVERELTAPAEPVPATGASVAADGAARWGDYPAGPAFLQHLTAGSSPRAGWTVLPGADWPAAFATAAVATLDSGRGAVLCVPDRRDVDRLAAACDAVLGAGVHTTLTADLGPAARYRAFLAVARGQVRLVIGTRAAVFAPVHDLGLLAIWDDGDDLHAEPRAPYPHAREVLVLRAEQTGCAALLAGHARTAEVQALLEAGWVQPLEAARARVRARAARVEVSGELDSELARDPSARAVRLPHRAFAVARAALEQGPVLVQVPRAGYLPALACQSCRRTAQCGNCAGPLVVVVAGAQPTCRWCGQPAARWQCPHCGGARLRAPAVGSARTAEELGRAFPATTIQRSSGDAVLAEVDDRPALVVATPGAEPLADGGYRAALILDSWLTLARPDLRTAEEALRRWLTAAALVQPAADGGRVIVVGDASVPAIQALVRWDPGGFAARELAERTSARLPPAVRLASLTGPRAAVRELLDDLELPAAAETFGPVPVDDDSVRAVLRGPHTAAAALSEALRAGQARRSARKLVTVRVQVDPVALG
jgi:primosomal protein N' (replication factor Y)